MKIEIELTRAEQIYISENCIQRVVNSALDALPADYEHVVDMMELSQIMEPLRNKMFNALFVAKQKDAMPMDKALKKLIAELQLIAQQIAAPGLVTEVTAREAADMLMTLDRTGAALAHALSNSMTENARLKNEPRK